VAPAPGPRAIPVEIDELRIAADPGAWERFGFAVQDGECVVGRVRLRFAGGDGGLLAWSLRGATSTQLDGLPTSTTETAPPRPADHPNGASRIDHLVVFTPNLGRTAAALDGAGLELRRVRDPSEPGPPVKQGFFRLAEVILEVVEGSDMPSGPARFWGITFRVGDLDACVGLLGDRVGEPRAAVQPGRRIVTARRSAGLGLPVALISEPVRLV
jgi:hypothetical protein